MAGGTATPPPGSPCDRQRLDPGAWDDWRDTWLATNHAEIVELHHRRRIHDEFLALLQGQDPGEGNRDTTFADTFHLMYIEATVMAICRQADTTPRRSRSAREPPQAVHAKGPCRAVAR